MSSPSRPQVWADAMAAFDVWSELPEAERFAWLQTLAAAKPELHVRVLALIDADRDAEERSFLSPDATPEGAPATGLEGQRLGPWLVERLIGSGGMGQVWLARRPD